MVSRPVAGIQVDGFLNKIHPFQRNGGGGGGINPDWKRETVNDLNLVSRPAAGVRVDGFQVLTKLPYPAQWRRRRWH
jgi:hypothetical protein